MNETKPIITLELYELSRAMRRLFDARARDLGFTQGQWRILAQLSRHEGISQAGLADILEMQPISLARALDRMETNGLIERRPDPKDRRALKLFLMPAAGPMLEILRQVSDELRSIATSNLSSAEQETLVQLLGKIRHSLENTSQQNGLGRIARPT
jgi:DNA-binding MarR family transcriptional regulator